MKILKYGFFGEDEPLRIFLQNYLRTISTEQIQFAKDIPFAKRFKVANKKQVDTQFAEVCERGLTDYRQDCIFVGRDLDTFDSTIFQQKLGAMQQQAGRWVKQTLFLIPVQCIEHWLWYLKWRQENPSATKNINLESRTRGEAKQMVYGSHKPPPKLSIPIVDALSSQFDVEWLCTRSESFNTFHQAVIRFLAAM